MALMVLLTVVVNLIAISTVQIEQELPARRRISSFTYSLPTRAIPCSKEKLNFSSAVGLVPCF